MCESVPRAITRRDRDNGWLAMPYVAGDSKMKRFYDSRYGGKLEALSRAVAWRNEQWRRSRHERLLGVHYHERDELWVASWSTHQKCKRYFKTLFEACQCRWTHIDRLRRYLPSRYAFPDPATLFNCAVKRTEIPIEPSPETFLPWGRGLTGSERLESIIARFAISYTEAADVLGVTTRQLRRLRSGQGDSHQAAKYLLNHLT